MSDGPLQPGWLGQDLNDAGSSLAMSWSPSQLDDLLIPPLSAQNAECLRAKMAARYREWTGWDLAAGLAADPASENPHAR